ncbi:hypothetical protein pEaSNUABM5_00257 [Erwinia phage pEa_SNUABM_5]|uniref:Uncharacterized protein n=1 Tax=Erwinia phage pEa_SNUABM_5 TaxID=2797313 RepID=A0A7T8EPN0_9CAUD|nr:hypothetical protein MPK73_gp257 [Erwinia phage pEa_SNUABM_5]QQO90399.1 hypothetical protein pEaSNUABM5_00257 [Erwinia phage pEa_SNUABM_5]
MEYSSLIVKAGSLPALHINEKSNRRVFNYRRQYQSLIRMVLVQAGTAGMQQVINRWDVVIGRMRLFMIGV